ncbi:MerR family transcriptional regulator [Lutibacter sp. B2]|nr:MerR family transcriptional regulator [Lutibacter sp. B2]
MKEHYLIGEVAKIFNISTDTLRYYDKIGLLEPEKYKNNNYRYYSVDQFDYIYMMLLLKELNIPLKDMKDILYTKDVSKFINLMEIQEKDIDNKMEYLKVLKENVKNLKHQITNLDEDTHRILIKTCPAMWAVTVEWNGKEEDFDYNKMVELNKEIDSEWTSVSRFTMIISKETFLNNKGSYRYGMISEYESKSSSVEYFPSRSCVFSAYKGEYSHVYSKYLNMIEWIDKNGFLIDGDTVARSIISLCDKDYKNEYVCEIWIPIKHKK